MEIKTVLTGTTSLQAVIHDHNRENRKRLYGNVPDLGPIRKIYVFSTNVADRIWETFLEALPEEYRDSWRCSCCKEFVRKYGARVVLYKDPETQEVRQAPFFFFQSKALAGAPELQPAFAACEALLNEAKLVQFHGHYNYVRGTDQQTVLGNVTKGQCSDGTSYEHLFISGFVRDYVIYHNDWKKHKARAYDLLRGPVLAEKLKYVDALVEHLAVKHNKRSPNLLDFQERLKQFDGLEEKEFLYEALTNSLWLIHYNSSAVATVIDSLIDDENLDAAVRRLAEYMHFTTYRRPQEASLSQLATAQKELEDKGLMQYLQLRHTRVDELDWQKLSNDLSTTTPDETPADVMSGLFDTAINAGKNKPSKKQLATSKKTMSFQKFIQSLRDGEITGLYELTPTAKLSVLRSQVDATCPIGKNEDVLDLSVHWVQQSGREYRSAFHYEDYGIGQVIEDWNRGLSLIPAKDWLVSETGKNTEVVLRYEAKKAPKVSTPFVVSGDMLNSKFYPYRAAIQEVTKLVPDDGLVPVVVTSHSGRMGNIDDLPQPHDVIDTLFAEFKDSDVVYRLSIIG